MFPHISGPRLSRRAPGENEPLSPGPKRLQKLRFLPTSGAMVVGLLVWIICWAGRRAGGRPGGETLFASVCFGQGEVDRTWRLSHSNRRSSCSRYRGGRRGTLYGGRLQRTKYGGGRAAAHVHATTLPRRLREPPPHDGELPVDGLLLLCKMSSYPILTHALRNTESSTKNEWWGRVTMNRFFLDRVGCVLGHKKNKNSVCTGPSRILRWQ